MTDRPGTSSGLLDTSVVVDVAQLADKIPDDSAISAVTLAELSAGLHTPAKPEAKAERQLRLQWVERTFDPLPFDAEAARVYGSLAALVEASGRKPRKRIADLQIAATAVTNGLALYTRSPDDFRGLAAFLHVVAL